MFLCYRNSGLTAANKSFEPINTTLPLEAFLELRYSPTLLCDVW